MRWSRRSPSDPTLYAWVEIPGVLMIYEAD
jgi:hypothetical protein